MLRLLPKKPLLRGIIILIYLLFATTLVGAQTGRSIIISPPDVTEFPQISLYFDVLERDSSLVSDLSIDQLTIREDDHEQDIINFIALNPGIQLVTAFNISAPFAIQDINGKSRFDFIQEGLLNWADLLPSSKDNLSLISNEGLEITHLTKNTDFISSLNDYSPNLREADPNFNVLSRAIEIAGDPVDQLGMKRVVMLFTPPASSESIAAIESLISQANENQVRVHIILVSSPAFFTSPGAQILQDLAHQTSGVFTTYSGEEPLPDFGTMLSPLRDTYIIQYQSQIVTAGNHFLEITISSPLGDSVGQKEFFLDIQPPNPIFISPPRVIRRELVKSDSETSDLTIFQPDSMNLDVIIEFPDNHPRDLEEVIFRVDGEVVDRKTSPPYNQFVWDLTPYKTSAVHHLAIEAVDILGLSRQSVQTPVEIQINNPVLPVTTILEDNILPIGGLIILLTLGLFLFSLIKRGAIKPTIYFGRNRFFNRMSDVESGSTVRKISPEQNKKPGEKSQALFGYRLIPVSDVAQQLITGPIQIWENDVYFGNDPASEIINIHHPSVAKIHSQITIKQDGDIQIKDEGSTAGTWINYKQILSSKPQPVKDGDIIHIGEAGFRIQVLERKGEPPLIEEKTQ